MLESVFSEFFTDLSTSFSNPQKRVFIGYIFCAFTLGIFWLVYKKGYNFKSALTVAFSKRIWLSNSSILDYKVFVLNKIIAILMSPILLSHLAIASSLFFWLHEIFPSRPTLLVDQPIWLGSLLFTAVYFTFDDFAKFYIHRLMHRIPTLWAFHKVHHSAETLTPITVFRAHPIEILLFSLRSSIVQAICIATFIFFFGDNITLTSILGANIFIFVFNILGSNLRHSHIAIPYWPAIEKIFISPAQHQIHHSVEVQHHDKNFGVTLAIWDWMFGSLHHSEPELNLHFGLTKTTVIKHSLKELYLNPFYDAALSVQSKFRSFMACIKPEVEPKVQKRPFHTSNIKTSNIKT